MTYTESIARTALEMFGDNPTTRFALDQTIAELSGPRRCEICGRRALATGTEPRCAEHDEEMKG